MHLPKIAKINQRYHPPALKPLREETRKVLRKSNLHQRIKPGENVAIAVGSRGITSMALVLKELITYLKALGANCYVAPAMGSHGGATAHGQADILRQLGITYESVGAKVISSMDTEVLGVGNFGQPIYCGRDFTMANHVVLVNRIKPHTSFRGTVESGLYKLMAVGMGKKDGATTAHQYFLRYGFDPVVLNMGNIVLEKLPVLCGVALVENCLDEIAIIKVLEPEEVLIEEQKLLIEARQMMSKVPFTNVDLLIVDEMGKNISGTGMDSNIIGRILHQATPEPEKRYFKRIFVRDLTKESGGNALGIGAADFTTKRLADKIDFEKTRINCITATAPEKGRIPFIYNYDRRAVKDGIATAGISNPKKVRLVWIKNTLELDYMWVSEALLNDLKTLPEIQLLTDFMPMPFDAKGNLPFGTFCHKHK